MRLQALELTDGVEMCLWLPVIAFDGGNYATTGIKVTSEFRNRAKGAILAIPALLHCAT